MKTVAIIGRPNVGKSAFFNRLTRSRKALVHDLPGVTRDRLYGRVKWLDHEFRLIDTGGLEPGSPDIIKNHIEEQVDLALGEADLLLFMVDGKTGVHTLDEYIASFLRRSGLPVVVVVNKVDSEKHSDVCPEFYELGFDDIRWVSAVHGLNVGELLDAVTDRLFGLNDKDDLDQEDPGVDGPLRVTVVGRPNVGKSSLINFLIKEKRLIVDDQPGTTRGPVDVPFVIEDRDIILVDTAGIKRRKRKDSEIERLCSATARSSIRRAHIVVQLVDATAGILSQDKHIAGEVARQNRASIIAVNKWDLVDNKEDARKEWTAAIEKQFRFLPHATVTYISALTGRGCKSLIDRVALVADCCRTRISTGRLNQLFREAMLLHEPPARKGGKRLKIFYATQIRSRPGTFALFVNDPRLQHFSFERYLEKTIRRTADFTGVPIRFLYRRRNARPKD